MRFTKNVPRGKLPIEEFGSVKRYQIPHYTPNPPPKNM